ncbi:ABC transporter A, ABCA, partial [Kipferlia bialata]
LTPVFLVYIIQRIMTKAPSVHPPTTYLDPLPSCDSVSSYLNCTPMAYAPNSEYINGYLQYIADHNDPPLNFDDFIGYEDADALFDGLQDGTMYALNALAFDHSYSCNNLNFTMYYNATSGSGLLSSYEHGELWNPRTFGLVQSAIVDACSEGWSGRHHELVVEPSFKEFPSVQKSNVDDVINIIISIFEYLALMIPFAVLVIELTLEKEKGLRQFMFVSGLNDLPDFIAWTLWYSLIYSCVIWVMWAVGKYLEISFFRFSTFSAQWLVFLPFGLSNIGIGLVLGSFVKKVRVGAILLIIVFTGGLFFQLILSMTAVIIPDLPEDFAWIQNLFNLYPSYHLAIILYIMGDKTERHTDPISGNIVDPDGFAVADVFAPWVSTVSQDEHEFIIWNECLWMLFIGLLCFVIALYLSTLSGVSHGHGEVPWYPLLPRYWGLSKKHRAIPHLPEGYTRDVAVQRLSLDDVSVERPGMGHQSSKDPLPPPDDMVIQVAQRIHAEGTPSRDSAEEYERERQRDDLPEGAQEGSASNSIVFRGLGKTFGSRNGKVHAVRGLWFEVQRNTCFGLLGLLRPTFGTATVEGHDLVHGMANIRRKVGLCPQFDRCFDKMSCIQHLCVFGLIRGISYSQSKKQGTKLLEQVGLTPALHRYSMALSGGMRRRLSVAIALSGAPSLVVLDEPTTGLDPASRRHLWDLITNLRKNHTILLTTHSMEEADALSDTVGIVGTGSLLCIGPAVRLKTVFGSGYRLVCDVADEEAKEALRAVFSREIPDATYPETHSPCSLSVLLPKTVQATVTALDLLERLCPTVDQKSLNLARVERERESHRDRSKRERGGRGRSKARSDEVKTNGLRGWVVRNSQLEEVFCRVVGVNS